MQFKLQQDWLEECSLKSQEISEQSQLPVLLLSKELSVCTKCFTMAVGTKKEHPSHHI